MICVDNQFLLISYSILNLGASSDYTAFLQNLGITSSDFSYTVRITPLCSFIIELAIAQVIFKRVRFVNYRLLSVKLFMKSFIFLQLK